jgi:hypothetical protein
LGPSPQASFALVATGLKIIIFLPLMGGGNKKGWELVIYVVGRTHHRLIDAGHRMKNGGLAYTVCPFPK